VTVDPSFSCALSNFAISEKKIISVNDFVAPTVSISAPEYEICAGNTLNLTATAQNAGALPSYQWILNNTNVGSNSPVFTSNNLLNGDQLYCLLTPVIPACSTSPVKSNTVTMIVNSLPAVTVSPTDTIVKAGTQLRLNGIVSGTIGSFHWEPSDKLENSSSLTPMTTALFSNTIYTLNVVSDKGCTAGKTVTVKIFEPLYMPNAFTPNGDGKNDVFRIPPDVSLKLEEFSIYDRWGTKVFSTENISKGWDGIVNGKQQATGVYVYIIKGTNEKGRIFLKGSFVLIR
jgi:gliding motility-associated-like protein